MISIHRSGTRAGSSSSSNSGFARPSDCGRKVLKPGTPEACQARRCRWIRQKPNICGHPFDELQCKKTSQISQKKRVYSCRRTPVLIQASKSLHRSASHSKAILAQSSPNGTGSLRTDRPQIEARTRSSSGTPSRRIAIHVKAPDRRRPSSPAPLQVFRS
jgi:hypothetical protein